MPVVEVYGMTEMHCYSTMNPMHGERRLGSVGLRLPYTGAHRRCRRRRHDPRRLPARHDRRRAMRGPGVFAGLSRPAARPGAFVGRRLGQFRRSRPARRRRLSLDHRPRQGPDHPRRPQHRPGRDRGGAVRHPAVETAAAVGQPDGYAGELPVAFVQLKPGATVDAGGAARILPPGNTRARRRAGAGRPIPTMPLTGVGKIFKPALRLDAAQRAFDAALMPLRADGMRVQVTVSNDPTHGTLATVRVKAPPARRS